ncbi:MAG: sigma-70 family RNA polymerase sigma factor [Thermodesulfovibrionales bacterium]
MIQRLPLDPISYFAAEGYVRVSSALGHYLSSGTHNDRNAPCWSEMIDAGKTVIDEDLVKAALAGDDDAFAELVRRYKRKIFIIVSKFVRDDDELDDISQEIFVKMYKGLGKYRGDAPFEHWLSKLAVNACYDMLRKRQRDDNKVPLEMVEYSLRSSDNPGSNSNEAWVMLRQALTELAPEDQLVITLLNLEGKSVREISELTGWSQAKVKVRAFRARTKLRKILGGQK